MAQYMWQGIIGTVAVWLSFVVLCLIFLSGCQDDQGDSSQPKSVSSSTKSENVKQEERQEFERCLNAAESGDVKEQINIAAMYYRGEGVKQDHKQALELFRKAAEQGIPNAQFMLGAMYARGDGVQRDQKQGIELIRKAARQGHKVAKQTLIDLGEQP
tara:strand:+ start:621 stop:1094 length:474 start_codon:yes stop_codon:yes gene_type:complete